MYIKHNVLKLLVIDIDQVVWGHRKGTSYDKRKCNK